MKYTLINALSVDGKTQVHKELYNIDYEVGTLEVGKQLHLSFLVNFVQCGEILRVFDIENLGVLEVTTDKGLYYLSKS